MKGILPLLLLFLFSCNNKGTTPVNNPPGYNLQKPVKVSLPLELDEISGLSFYDKDTTVFAINDEKGHLFKISAYPKLKVSVWKFSSHGDFEDIVLKDSIFYVLQSNGTISIVNMTDGTIMNNEVPLPVAGENEFESLMYNPAVNKLDVICKDCGDDKKKEVSVFRFDPVTNKYDDSVFTINTGAVFKNVKKKSFHLKASGAAVHPLTGEIYVISAVSKLLLILDKNYSVKSFHRLGSLFKQPEGITFSSSGTMIISNEAADAGTANLLLFTYGNKPTIDK